MKTIKEMESSELRAFLGIESVADKNSDTFDKWDEAHPGRDYLGATERREKLIKGLIDIMFCGTDDEDILTIRSAISDRQDARIIAEELVTIDTYLPLWEYVSEQDDYSEEVENYNGIDAYVEAARLELVENIFGGFADADEVRDLFTE